MLLRIFNRFQTTNQLLLLVSKRKISIKINNQSMINNEQRIDIAIFGGGIIGTSIGYFIKDNAPINLGVTVFERDPCVSSVFDRFFQCKFQFTFTIPSIHEHRQHYLLVVYDNNFLCQKIFKCHYLQPNFCKIFNN